MITKQREDVPLTDNNVSAIGTNRILVTRRALITGLVVALMLCAITPYNDQYIAATFMAGNFFPVGAFGAILILIMLVNPALMLLKQGNRVYTPSEILTVWAMIAVVSGLPASGLMRYLIPSLVGPHYYSTTSNDWEKGILSHIPARLMVNDKTATTAFFEGLKPGQSIPWMAWGEPLLLWGLFFSLLFLMFFCLSAILRRQWIEHEHLSFPLAQIPIIFSKSPDSGRMYNELLTSPRLWLAVGLVTVLHTIKGLHQFIPSVPDIPLRIATRDMFSNVPLSYFGEPNFTIYPVVIGFAYLISSEVCFSIWFFFLFMRLETMMGHIYNLDSGSLSLGACIAPAYVAYQEAGGAIVLVCWLVWSMRKHLVCVWRKAVLNSADVDDSAEPASYRFALFGGITALFGMFLWLVCAAQVAPVIAFGVIVGAIVVSIMISWIVAQAGLLFCEEAFSPIQILTASMGSQHLSASSLLVGCTAEHIGWYDARELMMPSLLHAYKGSAELNLSSRSLSKALAVCIACALVVSAAASIWLPYAHHGVGQMNNWTYVTAPNMPMSWTKNVLDNPRGSQASVIWNMAAGGLFVLLIFGCRTWIPSLTLHPAGFIIAASYPAYAFWFSLFVGWALKVPVLRYGGIRLYKIVLPFFLGLILGDYLNAIVWIGIGLVTHTGYNLLPN